MLSGLKAAAQARRGATCLHHVQMALVHEVADVKDGPADQPDLIDADVVHANLVEDIPEEKRASGSTAACEITKEAARVAATLRARQRAEGGEDGGEDGGEGGGEDGGEGSGGNVWQC